MFVCGSLRCIFDKNLGIATKIANSGYGGEVSGGDG